MAADGLLALALRCVECGADGLAKTAPSGFQCAKCGARFPQHSFGGIPVLLSSRSPLKTEDVLAYKVEPVALDKNAARRHWETGRLQELLRGVSGSRLLNCGSGDGGDRRWLEENGFSVTAFDVYPSPLTDCVCDGHELPFADEQFDVVTSIAVFEHLYDPFQAAREIFRVLKKGGALVASSAFLEPYHSESYFHMSHLGVREVLHRAGFVEILIRPGWSGLEALHSRFWIWNQVSIVRRMSLALDRTAFRLGLGLWRMGYRLKGKKPTDDLDLTYAGSLQVRAVKPL